MDFCRGQSARPCGWASFFRLLHLHFSEISVSSLRLWWNTSTRNIRIGRVAYFVGLCAMGNDSQVELGLFVFWLSEVKSLDLWNMNLWESICQKCSLIKNEDRQKYPVDQWAKSLLDFHIFVKNAVRENICDVVLSSTRQHNEPVDASTQEHREELSNQPFIGFLCWASTCHRVFVLKTTPQHSSRSWRCVNADNMVLREWHSFRHTWMTTSATKCDEHRDLQNSMNQLEVERKLLFELFLKAVCHYRK